MLVCANAEPVDASTATVATAETMRTRRRLFTGADSRKTRQGRQPWSPIGWQESRRGDSNPRPTTYEAVALPLSYSGGAVRIPDAPEPLADVRGMMPR